MSAEEILHQEPNKFMESILSGDADGMVGMDGSGNEWDTPQQIGSLAINADAWSERDV